MSTEQNKAALCRWVEAMNTCDLVVMDRVAV
jgi:hypothetical protein